MKHTVHVDNYQSWTVDDSGYRGAPFLITVTGDDPEGYRHTVTLTLTSAMVTQLTIDLLVLVRDSARTGERVEAE